jgi:AcrR family transcriptional regulator
MTQRSKRDQAKDLRRAQLLSAARTVFGNKGFHLATVDDITRAAGVAKGTFYLYFPEKKHIFYELIEGFFALVTRAGMSVSEEIEEVRTPDDFFRRVEQAARELARIFRDNRDLVRLTYRESMGMDERLEAMVREFYRRMAQVEADNIRLGVKLGLLRDDIDPLVAAFAHIGMVERVLLQWMFDRSSPEVPDLVHQIIELAYHGMQSPPA